MTKQFSVTAPDGLYASLARIAQRDRRSVSATTVLLLEGALGEATGWKSSGTTVPAVDPGASPSVLVLDEADGNPSGGPGLTAVVPPSVSSSAKGLAGVGGGVAADAARLPVTPVRGGRSPASVRKRAGMCQHRRGPETFCPVCDS